jgi:hypothetical protein
MQRHEQKYVGAAASTPADSKTAISTNKERTMYIGLGTVVVILVIVLLVAMMRRGSHV